MSEIAVIKGNDVRDKKLADSTAQTEVASTDGIRMVTTTGEEVYIARDSFANEVMKVINENVKTTVDGVFGVSGNEFGKITPANLANVLSGVSPINKLNIISLYNVPTASSFVTDINASGRYRGRTILAIASKQTSDKDSTMCQVDVLRCSYDDNTLTTYNLITQYSPTYSGGQNPITYTVSNGKIQINAQYGNAAVLFISNKL